MRKKLPEALVKGERGFDIEAAHFLAEMSELAYDPRAVVANLLSYYGAVKYRFFDKDDSQCIYAKFPTFSVIAFRGTELDADDIWTDLKFRKQDLEEIETGDSGFINRVHRGFDQAFDPLHDDLYHILSKDDQPLYFTGHSLGGALAVIGGTVLTIAKVRIVYTIGCPRVGNAAFAQNASVREGMHTHHRVVNSIDIVPMLPFMAMGYRHSGTLQYIDGRGCCHSSIPLHRQLIDQIKTLSGAIFKGEGWFGWLPKGPFKCHSIKSYLEALAKCSKNTDQERK